jgi:hypothetical protein
MKLRYGYSIALFKEKVKDAYIHHQRSFHDVSTPERQEQVDVLLSGYADSFCDVLLTYLDQDFDLGASFADKEEADAEA